MLPIVQIPGQQFNLLGGQRFNGQVCNRLGQRFAAVVQVLNFLVGVWYDFDIETLTEEDAGVYVDRVIQMAEANGAEIQIW